MEGQIDILKEVESEIPDFRSLKQKDGGFNIYRRGDYACKNYVNSYRRDFYKISLIEGTGKLFYANRGIEVRSTALLFSNPTVPYLWEATSINQAGYFCVFNEDFLSEREIGKLSSSPLFQPTADPLFFLSVAQTAYLGSIFEKMLAEFGSSYLLKFDLIRSCINLILHEALRMQPNNIYFSHGNNASERITLLFKESLERQFPIESTTNP